MPDRAAPRLTKRSVDALSARGRDTVYWDRDLPGFGVRVYRTGRKVYCVQARGPDGPRRATLGRHGDITAEEARRRAGAVIDRLKRGEDPVPPEPEPVLTVAALAERYMRAHVAVNCAAGTRQVFASIVDRHVVPSLGHLPAAAVERSHVTALHDAMRDTPYRANQTVRVLASMFRLGEAWGLLPPGCNPCRSVRLYRQRPRERFLTPEEYRRLGRVLDEAEADGSVSLSAVAAVRLLLLTGCRRNEIATLRWDDVDRTAGELRLRDAKTGTRRVPLTPAVAAVLAGIPRVEGNPWVIVGRKRGGRMTNLNEAWERLRARAGLDGVRLHDLRHSYASRALALGEGLPAIGKLLGHSQIATTMRYAHLARDTEKASAAKVGGSIGTDILAPGGDAEGKRGHGAA